MFVDHLASREIIVEFCSIVVNRSAKYKYTLGSTVLCIVEACWCCGGHHALCANHPGTHAREYIYAIPSWVIPVRYKSGEFFS